MKVPTLKVPLGFRVEMEKNGRGILECTPFCVELNANPIHLTRNLLLPSLPFPNANLLKPNWEDRVSNRLESPPTPKVLILGAGWEFRLEGVLSGGILTPTL